MNRSSRQPCAPNCSCSAALRLSIVAITLATLSFFTVASLVMLLFVGVVSRIDLSPLVAGLFMLAMGLLMAAVLMLVLEIRLGSRLVSQF